MYPVERVGSHLLLGPIAQHPFERRTFVVHGAVGTYERDGVRGVLYEDSVAPGAFGWRLLAGIGSSFCSLALLGLSAFGGRFAAGGYGQVESPDRRYQRR